MEMLRAYTSPIALEILYEYGVAIPRLDKLDPKFIYHILIRVLGETVDLEDKFKMTLNWAYKQMERQIDEGQHIMPFQYTETEWYETIALLKSEKDCDYEYELMASKTYEDLCHLADIIQDYINKREPISPLTIGAWLKGCKNTLDEFYIP